MRHNHYTCHRLVSRYLCVGCHTPCRDAVPTRHPLPFTLCCSGHAFLGSPHGAASVLSMAAPATPHGAAPMAAMPNMTGGMAMPYVPVPVPMPMPYMMPGAGPSVPGAPGGSVMGYLLPYQQDMYQALYDRLVGGV